MNIALTAIILIILLLPGATILRAYYTSIKEHSSAIHIPFTEIIFRGLVFSIAPHAIATCVLGLFDVYIDFQLLYDLLIGKEITFRSIAFTTNFLNFCLYSLILTSAVFILAKMFKLFVQSNNYDLEYFSLRNTNYWFQVFSARYLEARGIQGERSNTDLIYLDVLANGDIIYSGILVDFNYSPGRDELENIILHSARKRTFHKPDSSNQRIASGIVSDIPGDVLVIPSKEIININIWYLNFETTEQAHEMGDVAVNS